MGKSIGEFRDVDATTLLECQVQCNMAALCSGFEWRQGLAKCRILFGKKKISYGEPACENGKNVQCFINEDFVSRGCVSGPDYPHDKVGQSCQDYSFNPTLCGFFDTKEFNSTSCCACQEDECDYKTNENKKDRFGKGCTDYTENPEKYCKAVRNSKTLSHTDCCACLELQEKQLAQLESGVIRPIRDAIDSLEPTVLAAIITGSALGVLLIIGIIVAVVAVRGKTHKKKRDKSPRKPSQYDQSTEIIEFDAQKNPPPE